MTHRVEITDDVAATLSSMDAKSERICRDNLKKLQHPYPGRGIGDKEKIRVDGEELYRLHIGRTYTAFYTIHEDHVEVIELLPIDKAHKQYE